MDISQVYKQFFQEDVSLELNKSEKFLRARFIQESNVLIKQELAIMLMIILLKKNKFETTEMYDMFINLVKLIQEAEKKIIYNYKIKKNQANKIILDLFYRTNIFKLKEIEILYKDLDLINNMDQILVLRKDLEKNYLYVQKKYYNYLALSIQKIVSNYGTSFRYLFAVTLLLTLMFGLIYRFSDSITEKPYICGDDCVQKCIINNKGLGSTANGEYCEKDIVQLKGVDSYFYAALVTMTNLGGDFSRAGNTVLIIVFSIEQITGVVIFGTLVNLISNKLKN